MIFFSQTSWRFISVRPSLTKKDGVQNTSTLQWAGLLGAFGQVFCSSSSTPGTLNNHLDMDVSVGWWTKSLYRKWLEITKHPFINGWPWGSRQLYFRAYQQKSIRSAQFSSKVPQWYLKKNQRTFGAQFVLRVCFSKEKNVESSLTNQRGFRMENPCGRCKSARGQRSAEGKMGCTMLYPQRKGSSPNPDWAKGRTC